MMTETTKIEMRELTEAEKFKCTKPVDPQYTYADYVRQLEEEHEE